MARQIRDARIGSREGRARLKPRIHAYWAPIGERAAVGYRRLRGGKAGTFWLRTYAGERKYIVESVGVADDLADADGASVLSFWQAVDVARKKLAAGAGKRSVVTVADAVASYLEFLEGTRPKAAADARCRAHALILPSLGALKIDALTVDVLRRWHVAVAKAPARLRTKAGSKRQQHRAAADTDDAVRARRSTANRTLTILKAALNFSFNEGMVASDAAWRRLKPFRSVESARLRYLTVAEATRLINAADVEFRPMVQAALATGCRYGELCRLEVADFNADSATLAIRRSKAGKPRYAVLTDEGAAFFASLCTGRPGDALMLPRSDGSAWGPAHQSRPMREAVSRARIVPRVSFHGLRHTWASLSVMAGMPMAVVAQNMGHTSTRMCEAHYSHLAPSYVADTIRKHAPTFNFALSTNVTPLRQR